MALDALKLQTWYILIKENKCTKTNWKYWFVWFWKTGTLWKSKQINIFLRNIIVNVILRFLEDFRLSLWTPSLYCKWSINGGRYSSTTVLVPSTADTQSLGVLPVFCDGSTFFFQTLTTGVFQGSVLSSILQPHCAVYLPQSFTLHRGLPNPKLPKDRLQTKSLPLSL